MVATTGQLYRFRHRSYNFNGASEYSDAFETYACEDVSEPGAPQWITSTTDSIQIMWDEPVDNGGCPIIDYRVFRNDGLGGQVDTEVHYSELQG